MVSDLALEQSFSQLHGALLSGTPPENVNLTLLEEKMREKFDRKIGQMENPEQGLALIADIDQIHAKVSSICTTNTATRTRGVSRNKFTTVIIAMSDGTVHVGTAARNNYRSGDQYDPARGFMIALTRALDELLGFAPK